MDFLTYNGLLSAIPDGWKRSILNSEEVLNNSDEHNLTSANVTAKTARKMLVLEMLKPSIVEMKELNKISWLKLSMNYPSRPQWKINLDVFKIRSYVTFYPLTTNFTK